MATFHRAAAALACALCAGTAQAAFVRTDLVSNDVSKYPAQIQDPNLVNAWGVALRPAGLGGHWWIGNAGSGTTTLYVGDTATTPLFQDGLATVTVTQPPTLTGASTPTGVVFSGHPSDFGVTAGGVTGPSRFLFATDQGVIAGWTEQARTPPATGFARPLVTGTVVDNSAAGAMYFGLGVTTLADDNRLFAADFGRNRVDVFDKDFAALDLGPDAFRIPDGTVDQAAYAPFNVQVIEGLVYVAYAKLTAEPGEEETGVGLGVVAVFDANGKHVRTLQGGGLLNAPWGLAVAPQGFGELSGALLVGNFGDGSIVGFDRATGQQLDYLRTGDGNPLLVDGLWGLAFGNGASLGRADALYFAAGPDEEEGGIFGRIAADATDVPEPTSAALLLAGLCAGLLARRIRYG